MIALIIQIDILLKKSKSNDCKRKDDGLVGYTEGLTLFKGRNLVLKLGTNSCRIRVSRLYPQDAKYVGKTFPLDIDLNVTKFSRNSLSFNFQRQEPLFAPSPEVKDQCK